MKLNTRLRLLVAFAAFITAVLGTGQVVHAQQAPLTANMGSSRARIYYAPSASKVKRDAVYNAVMSSLTDTNSSGTFNVYAKNNDVVVEPAKSDTTMSLNLGSSVSKGEGNDSSGGSLTPSISFAGKGFALQASTNVGASATLTGDGKQSFGSSLLNLGSKTQSFSVMFLCAIPNWRMGGGTEKTASVITPTQGNGHLDVAPPPLIAVPMSPAELLRASISAKLKPKPLLIDGGDEHVAPLDPAHPVIPTDNNVSALDDSPAGDDNQVVTITKQRTSIYGRLNFAQLSFQGTDPSAPAPVGGAAAATKTVDGTVFAPSAGF